MADFYRAEKVNDRVTAILSLTGEIMYLVNGSERSLLIDTCLCAIYFGLCAGDAWSDGSDRQLVCDPWKAFQTGIIPDA